MKEKKVPGNVPAMKLAKIVREFAGLNPWRMTRAMEKKTIQAYQSFERSAKRLTLKDYFKLEQVYVDHGGNREDFDALARKCAKRD